MVKITIIGWYGTETIGDRVILAGIFSLLAESFGDFEVQLGSIYPFFTERTLIEDVDFYAYCADKQELNIKLFDSQNSRELDRSIEWCDILLMGGGPLMGFWSLYMVEYAFAKAHKLKKKTIVLGCGVGPMIQRKYETCLVNIISKSDITVFRDETSLLEYKRIAGKAAKEAYSSIDPAVFAAQKFKARHLDIVKEDFSIACVRDFPMEYKINNSISGENVNRKVLDILVNNQHETNRPLLLLPMHYFAIGGDDRAWMNQLKFKLDNPNIIVQNEPLSLEDTFTLFMKSSQCYGMRFHSVVLQTVLNGNNIILDYTDPIKGKIIGFLKQISALEYYKDSYISLQNDDLAKRLVSACDYKINNVVFEDFKQKYIKAIQ